jgi:hypothetical protein
LLRDRPLVARRGTIRRNILVQTKEIPGVVLGFDTPQALPSSPVGLGNTFFFIAAHEVYRDAWDH